MLNIVNLIENNPITRLNKEYNNELVNKIKKQFNETEQQMFVASFYCYLTVNAKDFVVELRNVWKWLGFTRIDHCKTLLIKHFTAQKDYLIVCEKAASAIAEAGSQPKNLGGAGLNKENILLTVNCFKKLCLKASTKKANEIHDYYIKLEELIHETLNEQTDELRKQIADKDTFFEKQLKQQKITERHNILLNNFKNNNGGIVYIIRVATLNNKYVIKIGESRVGIEARWKSHKHDYNEAVILDCFSVNRSKGFEKFIHDQLRSYRYVLPGHENEKELFLIGGDLSYFEVLQIVNNNMVYFNDSQCYEEMRQLRIENEMLKQESQPHDLTKLENKIQNLESKLDKCLELLNKNSTVTQTKFGEIKPTIGPRLQKINPENFHLIKVYETVTECLKENPSYNRAAINKAVKNNTVYRNFRWGLVDRDLDCKEVKIQETKEIAPRSLSYIVKLNMDKTKILAVYIDRKVASLRNGMQSVGSLDAPIKKQVPVSGYYYDIIDNCSDYLVSHFLKETNSDEIILYSNGLGQFDINGNLIKEFKSKHECSTKLGISDKSLRKAVELSIPYDNYFYKNLSSKTEITI